MRNITKLLRGIATGTLQFVYMEKERIYNEFSRLFFYKEEYEAMNNPNNSYGDSH